jgi:hypothetical protein
VLLQMLVHKVFAFVAVTSAELSAPIGPQRAWRAAMLALAACAIVWRRRDTLVLCLSAFAFYMVAVHVPLLYHHRYTVSALDVPLALLAAIALGECFSNHRRAAVATLAVVLAVGAGLAHLARAAPGTPHVERVPGQVLYSRELAQLPMLESENLSKREAGGYFLAPGAAFEIPVRYDQHPAGDYTVTIIGMAITPQAREPGCQWLRLRYREEAQPAFAPHRVVRVPLTADGRMRPLVIGTTYPLRLAPPGVLRLEFECASPATLELGQITIVAPRRGAVYRQRLLEKEKG